MTLDRVLFLRQAEALFQRHTTPRRKLLVRILDKAHHFSSEEVCQQVPEVGRATVYRTLTRLTKAGFLCRVSLEGGTVHYQLAPLRHHHHLVCLRCDRIVDVEACQVSGFVHQIARSQGFESISHRLEIYGVCSTCQAVGAPETAVVSERVKEQ